MESANVFVGSDEDCRSCESGWTMYLASQSQDHNDDYHYEDDDNEEEEESDGGDSMDSDASSGPMEATSGDLKTPQKIEDQNSVKKKKTNEKMVMVETTRANDDDDDDGDDHDYDDGNDNYSVVHSYVGSV